MDIPNVSLNGRKMPQVGLGTYKLTGKDVVPTIKTALELGYRHIDTADFYGNHEQIGKAILEFPRKDLFITSKVWPDDLHYDDIIEVCERALQEIATEYLDLLLVHWPNANIPMNETFSAMKHLKESGKILDFGVSNFTTRHLRKAISITDCIRINQVEFHPWLYQKELLDFCKENSIRITAYLPLTRGRHLDDPNLKKISYKHEKTPAQVLLRWGLQHDLVIIPKATSKQHLEENIQIFDFVLDDEDMAVLDRMPQERLVNPGVAEF